MAAPHTKAPSHKGASSRNSISSKAGGISKTKKKSKLPAPKPVQQKTKSTALPAKKKKRVYTDKELGIPQLNGIRPTGVQKPPNAKKGKNFVDDKESMNTILAMVMAEKEGNIESKMMRARQMEEIREAKRVEAEKRAEGKRKGFEDRKQEIKDSKKKRASAPAEQVVTAPEKKSRKRVSFG
ncbi:hypothetical protein AMS68_007180 [Peltaster fructicola]|uniref:60S ribosomal subunit assembly/export protein LOC1 n=1 Tax=Peltaster fructicola TaxID=286661 RepID=A0A6H0Y3T3_9PEZI|nr:hypothetical protein AMS68_007180 [Peltaster fructicola]